MNPLRHYANERDMSPTTREVAVLPNVAALEHRVKQLEAQNAELRRRIADLHSGGVIAIPGEW